MPMHSDQVPPSTSKIFFFSNCIRRGCAKKNGNAMPGVLSGLNHSLEIQACGRTRRSRAFNSDLEIAEAQLEQLLVGQGGPGKFLGRHEISNPGSDLDPL